jgi:hypothetical protein
MTRASRCRAIDTHDLTPVTIQRPKLIIGWFGAEIRDEAPRHADALVQFRGAVGRMDTAIGSRPNDGFQRCCGADRDHIGTGALDMVHQFNGKQARLGLDAFQRSRHQRRFNGTVCDDSQNGRGDEHQRSHRQRQARGQFHRRTPTQPDNVPRIVRSALSRVMRSVYSSKYVIMKQNHSLSSSKWSTHVNRK